LNNEGDPHPTTNPIMRWFIKHVITFLGVLQNVGLASLEDMSGWITTTDRKAKSQNYRKLWKVAATNDFQLAVTQ